MSAFAFGHMAMIALAVMIAAFRIFSWISAWRAHTATAHIREQAFVAQARSEAAHVS